LPAIKATGLPFITSAEWKPDAGKFGIAGVLLGTLSIAVVAVVIAVPIAMGAALFITEIAPTWMRSTLVALVDLMAAVPSVVYGLWGLFLLQGQVIGVARWLNTWLGWLPGFGVAGVRIEHPNLAAPQFERQRAQPGGPPAHAGRAARRRCRCGGCVDPQAHGRFSTRLRDGRAQHAHAHRPANLMPNPGDFPGDNP
jgi:hypothetical protein